MVRRHNRLRSGAGLGNRASAIPVEWELTPLRITGLYVAFGLAALVVSDVVLVAYLSDPLLGRVQAVKGAVEVLVTGGLIYALTHVSRRQLVTTNAALERRREELTLLHRVFRHNLRNDLNVIEGYAEQLADRTGTDRERAMCDRILAECDELIRYTERAAQIRRISAEGDNTEFDLAREIPDILADHALLTDDVTVRTDLPDSAPVGANYLLPEAIAELVTNAVVHAGDGGVELSISVVPDATPEGLTRVEVSDDGPGIPGHVQEVFSEFDTDQLVHLDGLGLWFVYLTVTASGGEFRVVSPEGGGTTVTLWLPAAGTNGQ